jgi:hypothetical protein
VKTQKAMVLGLSLVIALGLAAGCGSGAAQNEQQAATAQQTGQAGQKADKSMAMSMPAGDPMPLMKDLDAQLRDMSEQIKNGQMMDAQNSAVKIAGLSDNIAPHIMDAALKDRLHKAAYDLRDTVNNGKTDQTVIEDKMQVLQDMLPQVMKDLDSMHSMNM